MLYICKKMSIKVYRLPKNTRLQCDCAKGASKKEKPTFFGNFAPDFCSLHLKNEPKPQPVVAQKSPNHYLLILLPKNKEY